MMEFANIAWEFIPIRKVSDGDRGVGSRDKGQRSLVDSCDGLPLFPALDYFFEFSDGN